jgi:O-glycosyl hydrolase
MKGQKVLRTIWYMIGILFFGILAYPGFAEVNVSVDFDKKLQTWDGFGVNYVEVCQTRDYKNNPQEYGGLSTLSKTKQDEVIDLFFGNDGLKPGVVKMFQDSFHEGVDISENDNDDPFTINPDGFDHKTTTKWMRHFVREGLKKTRARGDNFEIIVTMYGPPAWVTKQKFVRGRDLDPTMKYEAAEYAIAWAKFLREEEGFPVKYISLHNEGEDFVRWPMDGKTSGGKNHDYNMYWPPHQVSDFVRFMRSMLDNKGMHDVGITPGETSNWNRFVEWGYAAAIALDPEALQNLGLITSHGFVGGGGRWYSTHDGKGVRLIRLGRPELHAWTTSMTWGKMNVNFVNDLRGQIYDVKVNACIPWAAIQTLTWVGGDPNPGCAIFVDGKGGYEVRPGYYFYKLVTRAGQPGMAVAEWKSDDEEVTMIAFAQNGAKNKDAFTVINISDETKEITIDVDNSTCSDFDIYRTSQKDNYKSLGSMKVKDGVVKYRAPAGSATTFFGK